MKGGASRPKLAPFHKGVVVVTASAQALTALTTSAGPADVQRRRILRDEAYPRHMASVVRGKANCTRTLNAVDSSAATMTPCCMDVVGKRFGYRYVSLVATWLPS
jgi:hypothetical protein